MIEGEDDERRGGGEAGKLPVESREQSGVVHQRRGCWDAG